VTTPLAVALWMSEAGASMVCLLRALETAVCIGTDCVTKGSEVDGSVGGSHGTEIKEGFCLHLRRDERGSGFTAG
jgi:hypothetical protein